MHLALYATWTFFWGAQDSSRAAELRIALAILSVSFVAASLLAHQYFNPLVRAVYTVASVWLGFVSFFFLAACACWIVYGVPLLFGVHVEKHALAAVCFGLGLLAGIAAIVNAAWTRVVRVTVKLPNLPAAWRGPHSRPGQRFASRPRAKHRLSPPHRPETFAIASGRAVHPGRPV